MEPAWRVTARAPSLAFYQAPTVKWVGITGRRCKGQARRRLVTLTRRRKHSRVGIQANGGDIMQTSGGDQGIKLDENSSVK